MRSREAAWPVPTEACHRSQATVRARATCRGKNRWRTQILEPATGQRLKHHSSKTRSEFKRRDKKFVEAFGGDVQVEKITTASQVPGFIREASAIVDQSYHAGLGIGIRADDEPMRNYLLELADEGTLRAYILRAGGRAIA